MLISFMNRGGFVAIEAMSRGLPVIAPVVGGLRDYADAAEVLQLQDVAPASIADAIARLASDPDRCVKMGLAGRGMTSQWFSDARIARIYSEFSSLLRTSAVPPLSVDRPVHASVTLPEAMAEGRPH